MSHVAEIHTCPSLNGCLALKSGGRVLLQNATGSFVELPKRMQCLATDGPMVWGLDYSGKLHRLHFPTKQNAPEQDTELLPVWVRDSTIGKVTHLGRVTGGKVCAVTKQGRAFVWEPASDTPNDGQWQQDEQAANWLGVKRKPRGFVPQLGLKTLLGLVMMVALAMSFFPLYLRATRQRDAVTTLLATGSEIRYAYEFDADGNEIPNPEMPGPEWLRELIGDHWFVTPLELKGNKVDTQTLTALTTLQKLDINHRNVDLRFLAELQQLKSLKLNCYLNHTAPLAKLKNLESLEVNDCYLHQRQHERGDELTFFEAIGKLHKLTSLKIWIDRLPSKSELNLNPLGDLVSLRELDIYFDNRGSHSFDYQWIANLKNLEVAKLETAQSHEPLAGLTQLRELSICGRGGPLDTNTLAKLTNLESLSIRQCMRPPNMNWVAGLRKLKSLSLDSWWSDAPFISDSTPLKNLHHLARLQVDDEQSFDVELLKTTKLTLENMVCKLNSNPRCLLNRKEKVLRLADTNVHDLDLIPTDIQLKRVILHSNHITDIQPLEHQKEIKVCDLSNNPISDISVLAKLPALEEIYLSGCPVTNLSPLKDANQLKNIAAAGTKITELPQLSSRQLKSLDLSRTKIESFSVPESEYSLQVNLSKTLVRDLSKLPTHMTVVDLSDTRVSDLSALKDWSRIESLNLSNTAVTDLSSLPPMPTLRMLDLSGTQIKSIKGLEQLFNLEELKLSKTNIRDISPLRSLFRLEKLHLDETNVVEISAIKGLQRLNFLSVAGTKVDNISALKPLDRLITLDLSKSSVSDLAPLQGKRFLNRLSIAETPVSSLEAIKDCYAANRYDGGIKEINLANSKVTDLLWVEKLHLNSLDISNTEIKSLEGMKQACQKLTALNCPRLKIGQGISKLWIRTLLIDCTGSDDLSGIANDDVHFLTLQNVRSNHRLDWLKEMKVMSKLAFIGPPVELDPNKREIKLPQHLERLRIPQGSRVSPQLQKQMPRLHLIYSE